MTPARCRLMRISSACPSSSSARRMINGSGVMESGSFCFARRGRREERRGPFQECREGNEEGATLADGGLEPDTAALAFDHAMDDGQAHPFARCCLGVQSLEGLEHLRSAGLAYAQTVVPDVPGAQPGRCLVLGQAAHLDAAWP